MRFLITGATGFVGGHIAEAAIRRGHQVTAIVRPSSKTDELRSWGVTIETGELTDAALVRRLVLETDVVVNCAAKVGDWGPIDDFRAVNVLPLKVLLDACKGQALHRFVQISSLGVYEARHHRATDETTPAYLKHRDSYSQSKAEAEGVAMQYYRDVGVPVTILRPGFVYGPRDKIVLPRIIEFLKKRAVRYPGAKGKRALNTIFVRNLVEAVFLALANEGAVGQIYNLTDGETVSKRQFIEKIADHFGLPHPHLMPPLWLAWAVAWVMEKGAKAVGSKQAPALNFARLKFLGLNLDFSIEKAKRELGYKPRYTFNEAMAETLAWYKE